MTPTITVLLIADGSPGIPRASLLERRGIQALRADDAIDALTQLDSEDVDGLVCGVALESFPIDEFVTLAREHQPDVPLVLVGEPDRPAALYRALVQGAVDYVEPEAEPGTAADRIERAVARRRAGEALDDHARIKSLLWEVTRTLTGATSRREIEEAVYVELSQSDLYRFVWIGSYDEATGGLALNVPFDGLLEPSELGTLLGTDDTALIERAVSDAAVTTAHGRADTRSAAGVATGSRPGAVSDRSMSSAVVPLAEDGEAVGAAVLLTDRRHAFDGAERRALRELGTVVAHAVDLTGTDGEQVDETRQFAGMLAHELRNPLGIAVSHLDLAREYGEGDDFDRIEAALEQIDETIEALLTVVGGEAVDELTRGSLGDDAEAAWDDLDAQEAELVVVESSRFAADHELVVRMLAGLFRNAVTHAGEEVTVNVGTLPDGFYVEDDGPGIPSELRTRVFDWGYSTDDGLGIGLSFVQAVADAHGWEVTVTEGEAGGARFEVTGVEPG